MTISTSLICHISFLTTILFCIIFVTRIQFFTTFQNIDINSTLCQINVFLSIVYNCILTISYRTHTICSKERKTLITIELVIALIINITCIAISIFLLYNLSDESVAAFHCYTGAILVLVNSALIYWIIFIVKCCETNNNESSQSLL